MRMPPVVIATLRLIETYGVFHEARLMAHAKLKGAPERIVKMLDVWSKLLGVMDKQAAAIGAARRDRVRARAALILANHNADRMLGRMSAAIDADQAAPTNKTDKKKILRTNPSDVARLPYTEQIGAMRSMAKEIADSSLVTAKSLVKEFGESADALEAALKAYAEARRLQTDAREKGEDLELDFRHVYNGNYGGLRELYKEDVAFVETFFYKEDRQDRDDDAAAGPKGEGTEPKTA